MQQIKQKPLLLVLIMSVSVSACIYCYTGEIAYSYEETDRFSYANPRYVFNVVIGIAALGLGTWSILKLSRFAELEQKKREA